jgi:hypothetical protein
MRLVKGLVEGCKSIDLHPSHHAMMLKAGPFTNCNVATNVNQSKTSIT